MHTWTTFRRRHLAAVSTVWLALSLWGIRTIAGPADSAAAHVLGVTTTIQAAVDAAHPGDIIVVPPGTYHESLTVTTDQLTIVGSHDAILDAGNRIGIRVGTGERIVRDGVRVCPPRTVQHFTLQGLTIQHARFAGVFLIGVHGYHLTGTHYRDNPVYGPFPVCSTQGLIDFNLVEGGDAAGRDVSVDAGIYVGDSDTVTVRYNTVTHHAIGVEIENTVHAVVQDNLLRDNTGGILVVVLPGLDQPVTEDVRLERNLVLENNAPNPVPADSDDPLGRLPTGTGILNLGGDRVVIRHNSVLGHHSVGVGIVQNPFAALDPRIEPYPDANVVRGNVILRNGRAPDPVRATTPGVDIVYDGTGVGTCFAHNLFETTFPPGALGCVQGLAEHDDRGR
jgi:parallel beta-helix repeat protein